MLQLLVGAAARGSLLLLLLLPLWPRKSHAHPCPCRLLALSWPPVARRPSPRRPSPPT